MSLQKLFAAVGVVAVLVVLGGAAWRAFAPPVQQGAGTGTGVARKISELSINRHFQVCLAPAGYIGGTGTTPQFSVMLPQSVGVAISSLDSAGGADTLPIVVQINGVQVWRGSVQQAGGQRAVSRAVFSPPIIVRPGELLEIGTTLGSLSKAIDLCMSGYTLTAEDFGL